MAIQTKLALVQEIRYEVYGGEPPIEATLSENFVLRRLNNEIADFAYRQALQNSNIEGIMYADDIFNITYGAVPLTLDSIYGLYTAKLPAIPLGLPRNRALQIFPSTPDKTLFKPINRSEYMQMLSLPKLKKVYYFVENNSVYFDCSGMNPLFVMQPVNMTITTPGALDMDEELHMPAEAIKTIKNTLVPILKSAAMTPQDNVVDGVYQTEPK